MKILNESNIFNLISKAIELREHLEEKRPLALCERILCDEQDDMQTEIKITMRRIKLKTDENGRIYESLL